MIPIENERKVGCACGCGKFIIAPEEFFNGILNLQRRFEKDFVTCYIFFKEGHINNSVSGIKCVVVPDKPSSLTGK